MTHQVRFISLVGKTFLGFIAGEGFYRMLEEYMELQKVTLSVWRYIDYISKGRRHEILWPKLFQIILDMMT